MSELKAASLFELEKVLQGRSNKLFYSKSEADKVIAEMDKKTIQLEALIENYNRISREIIDNANHQKHKRCLVMAELCCERKENCYNIALRKYTKSEADFLVKKSKFWEEWEDTWVQLAYRFNKTYNENKNQ